MERQKSELELAIGNMAEGIAQVVFADDYYTRPWYFALVVDGKKVGKKCTNHTTAVAWLNYLKRQGYDVIGYQLEHGVVPRKKPKGFPAHWFE